MASSIEEMYFEARINAVVVSVRLLRPALLVGVSRGEGILTSFSDANANALFSSTSFFSL